MRARGGGARILQSHDVFWGAAVAAESVKGFFVDTALGASARIAAATSWYGAARGSRTCACVTGAGASAASARADSACASVAVTGATRVAAHELAGTASHGRTEPLIGVFELGAPQEDQARNTEPATCGANALLHDFSQPSVCCVADPLHTLHRLHAASR